MIAIYYSTDNTDSNDAGGGMRHVADALTVSGGCSGSCFRKVDAELRRVLIELDAAGKARKKQEAIDWFNGLPPWAPERHAWTPADRVSRQAVHSRPIDARYRRGGRGAHNHHWDGVVN